MTAVQWITYVVACVGVLFFIGRLPRIWRGDLDRYQVPTTWLWDPIIWRALIRAGPAALPGAITMIVGLPVLLSVPEQPQGGFARPLVVAIPFLVLFVLSVLLMVCVALFNRPRFIVAPHLRQAPGALAEYAARRHRRRHRRQRQ